MHPLLRRLACPAFVALLVIPFAVGCAAPPAEAHQDNPYTGATAYLNPDYAASVDTAIAATSNATLKARMATVKSYPTSVWLDRIAAIAGTGGSRGLRAHLDAALAQKQGTTPITATFVVYDLPGRDCAALASNGELPLTEAGLATYQTSYIDAVTAIMADPKYAGIRIVAEVEPDSLPNLVTNLNLPACAQANSTGIYVRGVQYAIQKLHAIPNVYTYVDLAHSGWLGWDDNRQKIVQSYSSIFGSIPNGFANVDGFVTNTANTTPTVEPFLTDPMGNLNGTPIRSSAHYEWNPTFDEQDFTAAMYRDFTNAGWPATLGFTIDTSRNGWGGPGRPTALSTSTALETYVNQSRIDTRAHRGLWCNPAGAGIGLPPQASPAGFAPSHLDAFVWVKPPGESDGASQVVPNDEGKGFDQMCDPTFMTKYNVLTGALPNAPLAGHWFLAQFTQLVQNASPAIPTTTGGGTTTTTAAPGGTTTTRPATTTTMRPATTTTAVPTGGACMAVLHIDNAWGDGGNETATITNRGAAISHWTFSFTMPAGQHVVNLWNGTFTQAGQVVTVTDAGYNGPVAAGATVSFGFQFSHTGISTAGTGARLNGVACV